jgi:hypothetical protein
MIDDLRGGRKGKKGKSDMLDGEDDGGVKVSARSVMYRDFFGGGTGYPAEEEEGVDDSEDQDEDDSMGKPWDRAVSRFYLNSSVQGFSNRQLIGDEPHSVLM